MSTLMGTGMQEKTSRTEVKDLGEFGLIKHLTKNIVIQNSSTKTGVGDDGAVLDYGDREVVVSTDMLIEGVHFDMVFNPLKHLGYKAIIVNLSDIYAMNAHPRQVTISLGISSKFSVEALEELYEGMVLAGKIYGVDIVGGDTTTCNAGLVISVTAIGEVAKGKAVYRNGAKEKDLLVVSGDLGACIYGAATFKQRKGGVESKPKYAAGPGWA